MRNINFSKWLSWSSQLLRLNKNAAKAKCKYIKYVRNVHVFKNLVIRFHFFIPWKTTNFFYTIFFLYFITDLSQYENYKQKGRDTHIWKGSWNKNLKETIQVAVKQLKPNEKNMLPFSQMCSNATSWDDPTLVKVYG